MAKVTREKFKIRGNVFDEFALRDLFHLEGKYFEQLESPVSIGKEANIFTAKTREGRLIVKIYRLESCDFNRMYDYIKRDPRYLNLKNKKREIIFSWAQREFRNIMKAREAGVRVPAPIHQVHNIVLLELIGKPNPAPQLKDARPKDPEKFYNKLKEEMKKLYCAGLVHGDLSEFNILNHEELPVLIDFSQGTTTRNSESDELLTRDVKNICRFFRKIGVKCDEESLKKEIIDSKKSDEDD